MTVSARADIMLKRNNLDTQLWTRLELLKPTCQVECVSVASLTREHKRSSLPTPAWTDEAQTKVRRNYALLKLMYQKLV